MKTLSYLFKDIFSLRDYLDSKDIRTNAAASESILIQVFSSITDRDILENVNSELLKAMPDAILVGSTSVGEILHGRLRFGTMVLSFSFFHETVLKTITIPASAGTELEMGKNCMREIKGLGEVAGILLLATPLGMDVARLFRGMSEENFPFPVFGGGAGVYDPSLQSMIFLGKEYFSQGAIAVAFISEKLHICTRTFLGWKPLSRELTITGTEGMLLKEIDGERAYDVYNRYLDIPNDKDFFKNALEFPILVQRNGETVARVPFFADDDGCIGFLADIQSGEKFQIGYGDPDSILRNSAAVHSELCAFEPESIFLYNCICRRFLLQNAVNLETEAFESIAPTTGFYTYGEFISSGNSINLLNSTIVVVAFREGEQSHCPRQTICPAKEDLPGALEQDPFSNKHSRIITRLLHFIGAVTSELEDANSAIRSLSCIDKLTQLNNRLKLDEVLQDELERSTRYGTDFSVILLDIDHFKNVNDDFGHLTGDLVLVELADILKKNVRVTDTVGRWGGEEFLIILPQTGLANALLAAEKIRAVVDKTEFTKAGHITCSFGVSSFREGDNQDTLLYRADKALYDAKNSGRNQVGSEKAGQ